MSKGQTMNSNTLKKSLLIFTLLHPVYFIGTLYFGLNSLVLDAIFATIAIGFYGYYLYFIWNIQAMKKTDKIFETLVALLFGIFAMWAWVQFNNLELD